MESRIMKILGKVRAWYVKYKEYRRKKRLERVKKLAKRRSMEEVQIMEYKGELYICTPWCSLMINMACKDPCPAVIVGPHLRQLIIR